ncbi:S-layer protein [cyanobacterium TDX16]|nr:S-layer protein [cyanobacterium TDX16]
MGKYYSLLVSGISILCFLAQITPLQAQTFIQVKSQKLKVKSSTDSRFPTPDFRLPTLDSPSFPTPQVSQLSDVQPDDWASRALQSLIWRYGIVTGYPNGKFLGNRPLSRYEFAAALSTAVRQLEGAIANGKPVQATQDDLATLEKLLQEYAAELKALQSRLDSLEARSAVLQAHEFSTTTKLAGQVIFAINGGGFGGDSLRNPTGTEIANNNPVTTLFYRTQLDFDTSFSGTDLLKIRLDTGSNGNRDNAAAVLEPNFGSGLDFSTRLSRNEDLGLGRLYYSFSADKNLQIVLGTAIAPTDYLDRNRYANRISVDFSTQALVNNYLLFPINEQGAGAVVNWQANEFLTLRAMYLAADAENSGSRDEVEGVSALTRLLYPDEGGDRGLFGNPYQGTVELEYSPNPAFTLRLQYSSGNTFDRHFGVFGANVELDLSRRLGLFGRYGYGSYDDTIFGDLEPSYWMVGISLRNLLLPGAVAGIAAGQPFVENTVGDATQTNFEAYYNFPLNENLAIAPLVQAIANPSNQADNGTIITGTLRTVFSF